MDKTFFAIVRRFGLIVAFVTLLGAIGGIAWAIYSYNIPVNENITVPKVLYRDFKPKPTAKPTVTGGYEDQTSANDPEGPKTSESDRVFEARLEGILKTASKYLQPELNLREAGLRSGCKAFISELPEKDQRTLSDDFMAQFEAATVSFVGDNSNSANMNDPSSDKRQRWEKFSQWMFKSYRSQINEETERIGNEKVKAQLRKAQAGIAVTAAGTSFVIFMLFTLMLVLLAIERNTRPQPKLVEEQPTPERLVA